MRWEVSFLDTLYFFEGYYFCFGNYDYINRESNIFYIPKKLLGHFLLDKKFYANCWKNNTKKETIKFKSFLFLGYSHLNVLQ